MSVFLDAHSLNLSRRLAGRRPSEGHIARRVQSALKLNLILICVQMQCSVIADQILSRGDLEQIYLRLCLDPGVSKSLLELVEEVLLRAPRSQSGRAKLGVLYLTHRISQSACRLDIAQVPGLLGRLHRAQIIVTVPGILDEFRHQNLVGTRAFLVLHLILLSCRVMLIAADVRDELDFGLHSGRFVQVGVECGRVARSQFFRVADLLFDHFLFLELHRCRHVLQELLPIDAFNLVLDRTLPLSILHAHFLLMAVAVLSERLDYFQPSVVYRVEMLRRGTIGFQDASRLVLLELFQRVWGQHCLLLRAPHGVRC